MKPLVYCYFLVLVLLSGCRVYERIVHPHRIPTPPPSPEYKAKLKADKERDKGLAKVTRKKTKQARKANGDTEASTDDSVPLATATGSAEETPRAMPDAPKLKYDKHQLMKKNKLLLPRKRTKVAKFSLWQRFKNVFRKKKGKRKKAIPKPPPDVSSPTDPNSIP